MSGWASGNAAEFRLRAQCQCHGALVTLGDVAEIFAADAGQAQRLASIELFPAPAGSQRRFVGVREVQDLLLLRGVNLTEHRFSGSSQVAVLGGVEPAPARREPTLEPSSLRKADRLIRDAVVKYLQQRAGKDVAWNVQFELSQAQARLLAGAVRTVSVASGNPPWTGVQRFEIAVDAPQGVTRFPVDVRVTAPPAVVVAVRSLPRGVIIRAGDVALEDVESKSSSQAAYTSIDEVIGKETTRCLPEGKVIPPDAVRWPVIVRRGDILTVYARSSGILVRTTGRARDGGSLGDLVAVESLQDRKTFFARVSGVREVEVLARPVRATTGGPPSVVRR